MGPSAPTPSARPLRHPLVTRQVSGGGRREEAWRCESRGRLAALVFAGLFLPSAQSLGHRQKAEQDRLQWATGVADSCHDVGGTKACRTYAEQRMCGEGWVLERCPLSCGACQSEQNRAADQDPCACPFDAAAGFDAPTIGFKAFMTGTYRIGASFEMATPTGCAQHCVRTEGCHAMQLKYFSSDRVDCHLLSVNASVSGLRSSTGTWEHYNRAKICAADTCGASPPDELEVIRVTPSAIGPTTTHMAVTVAYRGSALNGHTGGVLGGVLVTDMDGASGVKYAKVQNIQLDFLGVAERKAGVLGAYRELPHTGQQTIMVPTRSLPIPVGNISLKLWVSGMGRTFSTMVANASVDLMVAVPNPKPLNRVELLHTQPGVLRTDETMLSVYVRHNFSWFYDLCPHGGSRSLVQIQLKAHLKGSPRTIIGSGMRTPLDAIGQTSIMVEMDQGSIVAGELALEAKMTSSGFALIKGCPSTGDLKDAGDIPEGRGLFSNPKLSVEILDPDVPKEAVIDLQRVSPNVLGTRQNSATFTFRYDAPVCYQQLPCRIKIKLKVGSVLFAKTVSADLQNHQGSVRITLPISQPLPAGTATLQARLLPHRSARWNTDYLTESLSTILVQPSAVPQCGAGSVVAPGTKKNVLFISIDDLGGQLGSYGHPVAQTPNIDTLADRGTLFTHHYVDYPVCIPSRVATLTGVRATITRQLFEPHHFWDTPEITTIAAAFQGAGYSTYTFGKVFHAADFKGVSSAINGLKKTKYAQASLNDITNIRNVGGCGGTVPLIEFADLPNENYADGRVAQLAIETIQEHKLSHEPFWLAVGFNKPHAPYVAPKRYWDMYDGVNITLPPAVFPKGAPPIAHNNWNDLPKYSKPEAGYTCFDSMPVESGQFITRAYISAISFVDDLLGDVVGSLGCLADNTLIVLWSDHGYHMGEQSLWAKNSLFDMSANAPLIIVDPAADQYHSRQVQHAIVESVDIFPSVLELAGVPLPPLLSGTSMVPLLRNPDLEWKRAALTFSGSSGHFGYSLRTARYRYVEWIEMHGLHQAYRIGIGEIDRDQARQAEEPSLEQLRQIENRMQDISELLSDMLFEDDLLEVLDDDAIVVAQSLNDFKDFLPDYTITTVKSAIDKAGIALTRQIMLYDYETDPSSSVNQAQNPEYADVVAECAQLLMEHE